MQLKEWKVYLYKPTVDLNTISNKFIHYWTNEGENYPDVNDIEDYLRENYGDKYSWHYEENIRIEKNTIDVLKIELGLEELNQNKTIFLKLVDSSGKEIPQYFYATKINQTSDPNYDSISYSIICELDCWATFGCKMKYWLTQNDCTEKFLFLRKMCNRFFKLTSTSEHFWLDYLQMPYLMQTGNYIYQLIRDPDEENLTLQDWLWINSGKTEEMTSDEWYNNVWLKWTRDSGYVTSSLNINVPDDEQEDGGQVQLSSLPNGYSSLKSVAFPLFDEKLFNSNGKYRYYVLKIGNFTLPSGEFDGEHTQKRNGAIKLEKVHGVINDNGELKSYTDYISGETVCIIPFPKGTQERDYLFWLNSTDKGFLIGNGSVLGMLINDLPPHVLSLALRRFNNQEVQEQTLGDKLTIRDIKYTSINLSCPVSLSSFKLSATGLAGGRSTGIWRTQEFNNIYTTDGHVNPDAWAEHRTWTDPDQYDLFIVNGTHVENTTYCYAKTDLEWVAKEDPKTGETWQLSELWAGSNPSGVFLWFNQKVKIESTSEPGKLNYTLMSHVKENWTVLGTTDNIEVVPDITKIIPEKGKIYRESSWPTSPYYTVYLSTEEIDAMPVILHDFSYIPVNIAISPQSTNINEDKPVIGGTKFFNDIYKLLTIEKDEEEQELEKLNVIENEPLLYAPAFWQWIYYIDGLHKIILTPNMIDFNKFMNDNWKVRLNVNMTSHTGYKLDIDQIKNNLYPWTRSTIELISTDMIQFPSTTESYQNWLQSNIATQDTSKNAKNIDQDWARVNLPYNVFGNALGSVGSGIIGGASLAPAEELLGDFVSAGAISGGIEGLVTGIFSGIGLENAIKQMDAKWENSWRGTLSNMYSAPTSLNPSGFTTGSLIYSPSYPSQPEEKGYELFKTFTITNIAKREIWDDISTNGYFYKSECLFKDYLNRKKFNIIHCNFNNKDFYVDTYLRDKMLGSTMIFSQQMFINWFKMKCKQMIRVFKVNFDTTNFNQLVTNNTEIDYTLPLSLLE